MIFDCPSPSDIIYLKLAGSRGVVSEHLSELYTQVNNVAYDYRMSTPDLIVLIERKENGKTFKVSKADFIAYLQKTTYDNKTKIADLIIQPEAEMQTAEVTAFLEN